MEKKKKKKKQISDLKADQPENPILVFFGCTRLEKQVLLLLEVARARNFEPEPGSRLRLGRA